MKHNCTLEDKTLLDTSKESKSKLKRLFLISPEHPAGMQYFRSPLSIRKEQERQHNLKHFIIHPFSKFRAWYDVWMVLLLISLMITKPIDSGYMRAEVYQAMFYYKCYTIFTDAMSYVDIIVTCFTGYVDNETNTVELKRSKVMKKYMRSIYFITDLMSSIPRSLLYTDKIEEKTLWKIHGAVNICLLFKAIRLPSLVTYFYKSAHFFGCKSKGKLFLACSVMVSSLIVHYMACLQFAVPTFVQRYFVTIRQYDSWVYENNLFNRPLRYQYTMSFFKSSAFLLGIRMVIFKTTLTEEYVLAIITYIIGKILLAFVWITLAVSILNSRSMQIKFYEIMNQLEEYMKHKHLSLDLKNRISQFYNFKYQRKYFKESLINNMLSTNLKDDVDKHMYKSLIKNVSLFAELTPSEITQLIKYLIPELFLPNDIVSKSGTFGDSMFFLSSGTVAVYTASGKEICHLQDGAYFGEISLVLKGHLRIVTIVAVETSQVYRLKRNDFYNSLYKNKRLLESMLIAAEKRLKEAMEIEEMYKKTLFEKSYQIDA